MPDYAESECDRMTRSPVEWPLIEVVIEMMRHSRRVGGLCPKAEEHTFTLSAAVCTVLPKRSRVAACRVFNTRPIVLEKVQSSRIGFSLPDSQDRRG